MRQILINHTALTGCVADFIQNEVCIFLGSAFKWSIRMNYAIHLTASFYYSCLFLGQASNAITETHTAMSA